MKTVVLIVNRLAWFVPTLFGLLAIVFFISHIVPADPAAFVAGENATPETIAVIRASPSGILPTARSRWRAQRAIPLSTAER